MIILSILNVPLWKIIDVVVDTKIKMSAFFILKLREQLIHDNVNFYYYRYYYRCSGGNTIAVHDYLENYSQLIYTYKHSPRHALDYTTGIFVFSSALDETKFLLEATILPDNYMQIELKQNQIRIQKFTNCTKQGYKKNLFKFKSAILRTCDQLKTTF